MGKPQFDRTKAIWRRSTRNKSGECLEVAFVDELIGVRDSRHPDGPVLVFTRPEWDAFVKGAKDGEFDMQ